MGHSWWRTIDQGWLEYYRVLQDAATYHCMRWACQPGVLFLLKEFVDTMQCYAGFAGNSHRLEHSMTPNQAKPKYNPITKVLDEACNFCRDASSLDNKGKSSQPWSCHANDIAQATYLVSIQSEHATCILAVYDMHVLIHHRLLPRAERLLNHLFSVGNVTKYVSTSNKAHGTIVSLRNPQNMRNSELKIAAKNSM